MFNNILQKGKEIFNNIHDKILKKNEKSKGINVISKTEIEMSQRQIYILNKLSKGRKTQLCIKERATILLEVIDTPINVDVAQKIETTRQRVGRWKNKWIKNQKEIFRIELEEPHKLKRTIIRLLSDNERSGKPPKFKSEQIASIIFLSLQEPKLLGLPISNWTAETLRKAAIEMKIVDEISERQVGRYLEDMDIKVHQFQIWLNSIAKNPDFEKFKRRIEKICEVYKNSEELESKGILVTCSDEKTGVQAIEHLYPSKEVKPGAVQKVEAEYKRHGTTTIIATRDVNSGRIIEPMIQSTRTEKDYEVHIQNVINTAPGAKRIMIMDQLNTHMSESIVRLIACECGIDEATLGVKGKSGILKSKETRKEFLEDSSHRISFLFTPKHTSWMNQIEIWFSILGRQLLNRRYSFKSVQALEDKIREYIAYYNENLAKKFKWTYTGKLLRA